MRHEWIAYVFFDPLVRPPVAFWAAAEKASAPLLARDVGVWIAARTVEPLPIKELASVRMERVGTLRLRFAVEVGRLGDVLRATWATISICHDNLLVLHRVLLELSFEPWRSGAKLRRPRSVEDETCRDPVIGASKGT